jgi:hypothetical protein
MKAPNHTAATFSKTSYFPMALHPQQFGNHGCVDWTKGVTVSKKLQHISMGEVSICQSQHLGDVGIKHINGKRNIADLFTKEIKDSAHFKKIAFTSTTPPLVADALSTNLSQPDIIEGGISITGESWIKTMASSWIPG